MNKVLFFLLFLFIIHILYVTEFYKRSLINLTISGFLIIISGNLIQGNFSEAFTAPIQSEKVSYYYDSIKIIDWKLWLSSFNNLQATLLEHSKTHPPGAVLIYYFLSIGKSTFLISIVMTLISGLSIPVVYKIFINSGTCSSKSSFYTIIYALMPAFNIYSIMTLDAFLLFFMNLFLLGLIMVVKSEKFSIIGPFLIVSGFIISSLFTFAITFHLALLLIYSAFMIYKKNYYVIAITIITIVVTLIFYYILYLVSDYNYLISFITAIKLENHNGLALIVNPIDYLMTRIESVLEIIIFLSIPVVIALSTVKNKIDFKNNIVIISLFAIVILLLEFISGAYRTGETARACIFITSYVWMFIPNVNDKMHGQLFLFTALQTGIMQLIGNYYW